MSRAPAQIVPVHEETTADRGLDSPGPPPSVLVIGNFDGVHRGHQVVLGEAVARARDSGLCACVLTFDPHPAEVVGGGAPPTLTTLARRAELMGELGVDRVYVRRFDAQFAAWSPERFVRELVVGALRARCVVVGENFRFGAKRTGDLELLRAYGQELGFDALVHAFASDAHGPFSSTRAREAVAAGDFDEVRAVLGRPHALSGVVVRGDQRGRTLAFPTANLAEVAEILPPNGVYAVKVDRVAELAAQPGGPPTGTRASALADGVTNIGTRPTVGGGARTIETHLFDFSGDLYGSTLRVHLVASLRAERKFASLDDLKAQIARDAADARAKLAAR